jgi:hypothetical protein
MAQLLIRVVSKENPFDTYKDVKLTKRGDVIMAVEDDHVWGAIELTHPDWRILRCPNMTMAQAQSLLAPEQEEAALMPELRDPMAQARAQHLDVDHPGIPVAVRAYLADRRRTSPDYTMPNWFKLYSIRKVRPRRIDPTILG